MSVKHAIAGVSRADRTLKATLSVLQLPVKGSYSAVEVCKILGFSIATFWRLVRVCERDEAGRLRCPKCLDSFILGTHRRVSYAELVDFIRRNNGLEREVSGS